MLTMKNIILDPNPILRKKCLKCSLPIKKKYIKIGQEMLLFLKNSQDYKISKKLKLKSGVGIAAPQISITKQILAIYTEKILQNNFLNTIMFNPKIINFSKNYIYLKNGESCLSIKKQFKNKILRYEKIKISYINIKNETHYLTLNNYNSIVIQHEIDHLNGILFYDHIKK